MEIKKLLTYLLTPKLTYCLLFCPWSPTFCAGRCPIAHDCLQSQYSTQKWRFPSSKMVNGFRYYRALERVSIASALSTALSTIYPCQIRVHQRWQSKLQLPTARKKEWRPTTAGSSPPCGYLSTLIHTTLVGLEPATYTRNISQTASNTTTVAIKHQ